MVVAASERRSNTGYRIACLSIAVLGWAPLVYFWPDSSAHTPLDILLVSFFRSISHGELRVILAWVGLMLGTYSTIELMRIERRRWTVVLLTIWLVPYLVAMAAGVYFSVLHVPRHPAMQLQDSSLFHGPSPTAEESKEGGAAKANPSPGDVLVPLLKAGKYEQVSATLDRVHKEYERSPRLENEFHKLVYEFYRADPELKEPLDKWVDMGDGDAYAHLARGMYRTRMGWVSRGEKSAAETSDAQLKAMAAWFSVAKMDFYLAIASKPNLVEAYCYLIEIDTAEGGGRKHGVYEDVLKINPLSFVAREFMLHSLTPRWGGSHRKMAELIVAMKPLYYEMPELRALEGRIDADIGDQLLWTGDYKQAQRHLGRALAGGAFWFAEQRYGEVQYQLDNYPGAIDYFTRVIIYKPGYKRAWWMRAQSHRMMGNYSAALEDINRAIAMEPGDDGPIAARGYIYWQAGKLDLALQDFEAAVAINPSDRSHARAVDELRKAIQ